VLSPGHVTIKDQKSFYINLRFYVDYEAFCVFHWSTKNR